MKLLHSILMDRLSTLASHFLDPSEPQPLASGLPAFLKDWMKKRFGVSTLVQQNSWDLKKSLEVYRETNAFIELVSEFLDGSKTSAQLTTFLHCYGMVERIRADRPTDPQQLVHSHFINLEQAVKIVGKAFPFIQERQQERIRSRAWAMSVPSDPQQPNYTALDGQNLNLSNYLIEDAKFYGIAVDERFSLQQDFHQELTNRFKVADRAQIGVLDWVQTQRLLIEIIPWLDAHRVHNLTSQACPDLLRPGAKIDLQNLLTLDSKADFVGSTVSVNLYEPIDS
eukprot:CAMPEP_0184327450 /NCGR_PEP_ID=MMETSP1049-20130417/143100_1 /TAXON_ID=77928 /ORGANISM="Proteomonas sulcata, Strain CCMP704" /LENGTH=281 /DNA_ID=CAMNT_0026649707 /DNA_START=93 /DNA_END=938 /DNA_ORIENTATION=+